MEFKFSRSSLSRTLIRSSLFNSIVIHKHFHHAHAQICRCQMQGMSSKGQDSAKKALVHVVKEGETLTYISRIYGVPIGDIAAANKDSVDVDFVFEGQPLNIPSSITELVHKTNGAPESSIAQKVSSLSLYSRCLNLKYSTLLSFHHLSYAKSTGYFLVLVPLVVFCIRCIIGALQKRVPGDLKNDVVNESEGHYRGSKRMRWKSALLDLSDPDALDTDSRPELMDPDELDTDARPYYDHFVEDHNQMNSKDLSHTYLELERGYQKFLEECGMSKWGYWRGGSPK